MQMLKSCCPVFVLFVALAFRLEQFSVPLISSIVLIAAGTATTAASGVTAVSLLGLLIQFSSELCEAFRLCLAQILMCNMKLHQFEALKQMSAACVLFLTVGIWGMEWHRFREEKAWERVIAHPHWYIAAGVSLLSTTAAAVLKTLSSCCVIVCINKTWSSLVACALFMGIQATSTATTSSQDLYRWLFMFFSQNDAHRTVHDVFCRS